jgi:AbrB family looped-hinge helix DNA binding protein
MGELRKKSLYIFACHFRFAIYLYFVMTSTISCKGQITLPASLRRRLGWKPGTKLEFDEQDDGIVARPAFNADEMKSVLGCAATFEPAQSSHQILARNRGYERRDL